MWLLIGAEQVVYSWFLRAFSNGTSCLLQPKETPNGELKLAQIQEIILWRLHVVAVSHLMHYCCKNIDDSHFKKETLCLRRGCQFIQMLGFISPIHLAQCGICIKRRACGKNKDCQLLIMSFYWPPSLTMLLHNLIRCNCAIAIWSKGASKQNSIEPSLWLQHDSYPPMKNDSSPSKKASWYRSVTELPELFSALYVPDLLSYSRHFGCSTVSICKTIIDV